MIKISVLAIVNAVLLKIVFPDCSLLSFLIVNGLVHVVN